MRRWSATSTQAIARDDRDDAARARRRRARRRPRRVGCSDALLWRGALAWGDRTPAFLGARRSARRWSYNGETTGQRWPSSTSRRRWTARPRAWSFRAGCWTARSLLDAVMDVVRAEIIAGNGYPYSIEAADAVAVISTEDRARFYALFQQFAEREGLPFTFSRKALSKSRRRV